VPEPRRVYLDHNATTPIRPEVADVMTEALLRWGGNPSSSYRSGREAKAKMDEARRTVAGLLGAEPEGVVFTGSGTEADNLAARYALHARARHIDEAQARSVAKSEAESAARSSLLDLLKGLRIDSRQSFRELIEQSDEVQNQLRGLVRNVQMADVSYMHDGTVRAVIALRLTGAFADLLLPKNILNIESVRRHQKSVKPRESFTGLVVDCRGFQVTPALVPLIVDEDARAVYGSAYVSRDHAVQHGMVAYARNLEEIQKSPRVGPRPLNVKGLRTAKTGRSDIVISDADAAKIKGIPSNLDFLQKCRVIIVLD